MATTATTTMPPPSPEVIDELNGRFEGRPPELALSWAIENFMPRIVLSCSFGGPTGMVLLDMALRIDARLPIVIIDTGVLFPETYAVAEQVEQRYGIALQWVRPALTLDQQAAMHGPELWASDPDACCKIRKVEPLGRALAGKLAWITGVRRDQSKTRSTTRVIEWGSRYSLLKVNPLVGWSEREVWSYIVENNVPYNPLLDQGYKSLGCVPCTRHSNGEDPRSGRWAGFAKTECGIHTA
jgi:phosphoadenosine phosphosulfate reductase